MESVENQVQKHLVSFCKFLPVHVECWKSVLQESVKPLHSLVNFCEQRRHVKRARISYLDDFDDIQAALLFQITNRIEDELVKMKDIIDKLSKTNYDLKNKLLTFERSTVSLDWDQNSELITGNGSQPPLLRLLQSGLEFLTFFSKSSQNIGEHFKSLNVDDERSVKDLEASFDVNVEEKIVVNMLALTQYVDNEKSIQ